MTEEQKKIIDDWNKEIEDVFGASPIRELSDRVHLELSNPQGDARLLAQGVQQYAYVLPATYQTDNSGQILLDNVVEANRICMVEKPPYTSDVIKRLNTINPKFPHIWFYPFSNNENILNPIIYATPKNLPPGSIEGLTGAKTWMLALGKSYRSDLRYEYDVINAYLKMAWAAKEPMPVGAIPLRGGNWTTDPRLTWIPGDPNNRPKSKLIQGAKKASIEVIDTRRYPRKTWLDQGNQPACVGYAWSQLAAGAPCFAQGITNDTAYQLYLRAKELDEIPKSNYDGTTTYGGGMAAIEAGYIKDFEFLTDMDQVQKAHMETGVIIGIPWYEEMYTPDKWGNVGIGGALAGGHEIWQNANNIEKKGCREANSWGITFGIAGDFWLTWDQLDTLIYKLGGDAARPIYK